MFVGFFRLGMSRIANKIVTAKLPNNGKKVLLPMSFAHNLSAYRNTSTKTVITKDLLLTTAQDNKPIVVPYSRPLAVVMSWLMAQNRHIEKYVDFYMQQGFDVLTVKVTPWQFLRPTTGTQVIAQNMLDFLHSSTQYKKVVIHAFSVGGYLYGEMLLKMIKSVEKYGSLKTRIVGQILDSPVDCEGIPTGVPNSITKNPVLRKYLGHYTRFHLKIFHNQTNKHYLASAAIYHDNPVTSPALYLYSKDDPVADVQLVHVMISDWEAKGMKVYQKCWDSSPHVCHMRTHPKEYIEEINRFLKTIGVIAPSMNQLSIKETDQS